MLALALATSFGLATVLGLTAAGAHGPAHAADGPATIAGQVGGPVLAVDEHGGVTWIGVGPRVEAYATCGRDAQLLGRSAVLPGIVHDIVAGDRLAYAALGADGFGVLDVADPARPRMVGHTAVHGIVRKVVVQAPYAYLVAGYGGMPIVDLSDPRAPRVVGTFDAIVSDVAVAGDWAYVVARNLKLVNVADRSAPFERAKMAEWADAVDVREGRLYVGESDDPSRSRREGTLRVYDVGDPERRRPLVGQVGIGDPVKDIAFGAPGTERAWVLTRSELVEIGGVRAEASPHVLRRRPMVEPARTIALTADEIMVSLGGGGLLAVDAAGLADRDVVAGLGAAQNVVVAGRFAYVDDEGDAVRGERIRAFDMRDPRQPRAIGAIEASPEARAMVVGGEVLFVGDVDSTIRAYDIRAGFPAPELGRLALARKIWALDIFEDTLFVANDDRLVAVDVSEPRAMAVIGERTTTWGVTDVAVDGPAGLAVVTGPDSQRETYRDTIHRVDISNPAIMHQRAERPTDGWRSGLALGGGFAFAGETELQVYDVRAPDALTDSTTLEIEGDINDKALSGHRLALAVEIAEGGGFLHVADVSAPSAPVLSESLDLIDWVRGVAIDAERGLVYAAAHEAGLFVIGLDGPVAPPPPDTPPPAAATAVPAGDERIYLPILAKGGLAKACPAGP